MKMDNSSSATLFIAFNRCTTQQNFSEYLAENLPENKRDFTVTSVGKYSEEISEFEVEFKSKEEAREVLLLLANLKEFTTFLSDSSLQCEINYFKHGVQNSHALLLAKNEDSMLLLKERLIYITVPQSCSLEQHQQIVLQQKMLNQQIEECLLQRKEFTDYCIDLLLSLDSIATSDQLDSEMLGERFEKIKAKFGMECNRFSKPLPMYTRRQEILNTIEKHQVTILIGETGSGKSTQLVQYLYDAKVASDGIIVCTQPRKVAAIALANHVSREMCVRLGEELGYKVGISGKCSENTKVLYMTDHVLLNECIEDQTFSKYSCVVIDEAHERSLHTDLLLSFVKNCLPHRKDLRVIITSATIDPVVFLKYFGDCPVIRVPGRAYPVETIWRAVETVGNLPSSDEMISAAIDMVDVIHKTEEAGDVLVFLTSPGEVELACQLMSEMMDESVITLPLHGKLQPQDQQKVFHNYEGKRKVVFSTNVAETSVTIDGVKFVVDTGMAKELHFDPKRNMNTLEACWISKTSAEQRKGRAGRTCPGKCYRLYSEEMYGTMRDRMLPELLRVQLSHVVLKIYEVGLKNVLEFDFVEQPDVLTLQNAVEMLKFVEAIDEDGLTARGKTLATLPIDPQLGKVLLDGCEAGIGLEAAVVVAMSSAGGIFFRAGSNAEKEASDKKKLQFCHESGDHLTNLCVYWKWASQSKAKRNKWCFENSINAKSMRRVEETVKELQCILSTFGIEIATTLKDLNNAELYFPKVFFNAFLPNLAMYIGHERAGYMLTETQIGSFFMFPGSVLISQNLCPQVLVYEKILKTSRQFLLQLLPVKQEWLEEAVCSGRLPLHPMERFKSYLLSTVSLAQVGWQVYKSSGIMDYETKCQLMEICQGTPHSVDCSRTKVWGIVNIYSQNRYHSQARELCEQKFNAIRKEFMKEQHELGISADNDDVRLVIGKGGSIQHVLMPGECRTIVIKGPLNLEWTSEQMEQAVCLGDISDISLRSFPTFHLLIVTYCDPKDAAGALITLAAQDNDLLVENSRRHKGGQSVNTLKIEWCRRDRKNFAFIAFESPTHAKQLMLHDHPLYRFRQDVESCVANPSCTVFAGNVPTNDAVEDIEHAITTLLADDSVSAGAPFTVRLGYEKSFVTSPEKLFQLRYKLRKIVELHVKPNQYRLDMPVPDNHHREYRAYVELYNVADCQSVTNGLKEEKIDNHSLTVTPQFTSSVLFSPEIHRAVKSDLHSVLTTLVQRYASVVTIRKKQYQSGKVIIDLKAEDTQAYIEAKKMLSSLTLPSIKNYYSEPILREFVLHGRCKQVMADIGSRTSTVISINKWSATVNVYGSDEGKAEAINSIEQHFNTLLHGNIQSFDIHLKQKDRPPGLMKKIVSKFGLDLEQLTQRKGISGASLNVNKHILSVSATPEAHKCLQEEINELQSADGECTQHKQQLPDCCVCYSEIDCEDSLFRLECCGHVYCVECIQIQVTSPTATFPILCAAEQCSQPLVIQDFTALCRRVEYSMQQLAEASLRNFVYTNPDKVKNCLTPDCKMIYKITEEGTKFLCSLCGVTICTKCHVQYHDDLTCAMYQSVTRQGDDVAPWMMKDPARRKRCPKCSVPVEKKDGCNHIQCICGVHVCWVCLEYFTMSSSCYDHLVQVHGTHD